MDTVYIVILASLYLATYGLIRSLLRLRERT
jgi:hypothetical protein